MNIGITSSLKHSHPGVQNVVIGFVLAYNEIAIGVAVPPFVNMVYDGPNRKRLTHRHFGYHEMLQDVSSRGSWVHAITGIQIHIATSVLLALASRYRSP